MGILNFSDKTNLEKDNLQNWLSDARRVPDGDIEWGVDSHSSREFRTRVRSLQYAPEGGAALTLMAAMSEPLDKILLSDATTQKAQARESSLPIQAYHEQETVRAALDFEWGDLHRLPLNTLIANAPLDDAFTSSAALSDETQQLLEMLTAELRTAHELEWLADHHEGSSLMHMLNHLQPINTEVTPESTAARDERMPELETEHLLSPDAGLTCEMDLNAELLALAMAPQDGEAAMTSLQEILGMHDELRDWCTSNHEELSRGNVVEHYPFYVERNESWQMTDASGDLM